ncbi:MAG TPA: GNAT family N-acetyltransferase [Hyphomonadaceae bacterium]|nr:GNAT family N-acetyltransferase [Hyphomonadaceae bacterium]
MSIHPLDRPVWNALNTGWAKFALGKAPVVQLDPKYGPFAATADRSPDLLAALASCELGDLGLWVVEADAFPVPPGMQFSHNAPIAQMVTTEVAYKRPSFDVLKLTDADGPEMFALARLTRPGPFATHTHQLSQFIGVKQDGKLVAMAGERMRMPGFAELSGVCTHPDHRGHGYGAVLSSLITQRILDRGETAFLHAYSGNTGAIDLYKALGYSHRTTLTLTVLTR